MNETLAELTQRLGVTADDLHGMVVILMENEAMEEFEEEPEMEYEEIDQYVVQSNAEALRDEGMEAQLDFLSGRLGETEIKQRLLHLKGN